MSDSTIQTTGHRKRRLLSLSAALVAVFVVIGATPALAAPASSVTAVASGSVSRTGPTTFDLAGVGAANRLGAFTYVGNVTVTSMDPDSGVITDILIEQLVFPNGDSVVIKCDQVATPLPSGVLVGSDTWTVIGGTGRYQGATGSGTGTTYVDLEAGTFTKVLSGVISR